jgi:hypothetical protein
MPSLPTLALKSSNKIVTAFSELIKIPFQLLVETVLHKINIILCWGMIVQNKDITPRTS